MRKLYSFFLLVASMCILSSCKSYTPWFTTVVGSVDYYSAGLDGRVFITESNSVSFPYTPVGSLYLYQKSGYLKGSKTKTQTKVSGDPVYGYSESKETTSSKGEYKSADYNSALRAAAEEALKMGGDAIINLQLTKERVPNSTVSYPVVRGMVIKRK